MKFKDLKKAIIKDETDFFVEMMEDEGIDKSEINDYVNDIHDEINSSEDYEDLVYYFINSGHNERDAYRRLLSYLIED